MAGSPSLKIAEEDASPSLPQDDSSALRCPISGDDQTSSGNTTSSDVQTSSGEVANTSDDQASSGESPQWSEQLMFFVRMSDARLFQYCASFTPDLWRTLMCDRCVPNTQRWFS